MARPKEVKLELGTVYLQDFPPEVGNALAEYIRKFEFSTVLTTEAVVTLTKLDLTEKAIGTRISKVSNKAQFVTIAYNGETGEAKVDSIIDADGMRDSSVKFKIAAGTLGFV